MTTIRVALEAPNRKYTALSWDIPGHDVAFEPIPNNATIVVAKANPLFINRGRNRFPTMVDFEEAKTWGLEDDHPSVLYVQARSGDRSTRLCLRLIFNAEESTRDPASSTYQAYARLVQDAIFHSTRLFRVEGIFVPQHYGMWIMDTGEWAGTVLFSITQWCGQSWYDLSQTNLNTEANRMLVGRTLEALHDYGVEHGELGLACDLRHVVIDVHAPALTEEDVLNGNAPCYIVGFAEASDHHCGRRLPILPLDAFVDAKEMGCNEVANTTYLLKFMKGAQTRVSPTCDTYRALEWHREYSKHYPDTCNAHVMMAQRDKFYNEMPSIYSGLHVSFADNNIYSRAILERDVHHHS
ncbi:hypothetical protein B0H14DRAFT_2883860 [Mycena olivaceomarginata]|nr:hypothetical protein B0H14DRAFT_2883860 [Mycena olivaceomarginata]